MAQDYSYPSMKAHQFAPSLTQMNFYLTEGCNLACRHCWLAPKFDPAGNRYAKLPVTLFEDYVAFPEPPEEPGFAATVVIRLDADGFGIVSLTDVVLGEIEVEYPEGSGFYVTVTIVEIHIVGEADVEPIFFQLGDMNCDEIVNAYDIDGFICALSPACDYEAAYPNCDRRLADCNGDGNVNAYDIDGFIALVGGG